ncbi:MAG: tetratricopeptide repeat protein [Gemmatimonadaceae bacterium]
MAGTSRIDELRKKFDENPRRYFAPLANEYRKIGDFEQAIFICQEFLPQQPGHMSGHIVYGQALFESGKHDEARSVFETALALDPENLIALRHLGDIARAVGDTETARAWYRRVLESDPRNEEIAGILTALDADAGPIPEPGSAPSRPESPSGDATSGTPLSMESAISAATNGDAPAASVDPIVTDPLTTAPSESSFDDIAKLFTAASPSAAPATEPVVQQPSESGNDSLDLIHEGEDILGSPDEQPNITNTSILATGTAGAETRPSATEAPEAASKPYDLPFLAGLTNTEQVAPPTVERPAEAPARAPAPAAAPDAATAFVTETMAELYVKQGHLDQARDVYRQLVQLHPHDTAIAARLRELDTHGNASPRKEAPPPVAPEVVADAGPTIREFLGSIAEFRPRAAGAVSGSNGSVPGAPEVAPNEPEPSATRQSVAGSLNTLFGEAEHRTTPAGPPADLGFGLGNPTNAERPEQPLPGRPSTPAATELSLDHVFRHATPTSGTSAHSSFSFDQFFSQQAQQDVAASDAEAAGAESAGLSDDIQQFNAWLEGLKKS